MSKLWTNWRYWRWKLKRPKWLRTRAERRARRRALVAVSLSLALLLCAALWLAPRIPPLLTRWRMARIASWGEAQLPEGGLRAYFLDVGQADATILTCDGAAMVIDGGNVADAGLMYTMLRDELQVKHIDCMIATHPHEDHVGGLSGAIRACTVGSFYAPVLESDNRPFEITLEQARERGAKVAVPKPGERFALGGAQVEILGPRKASEDVNNMSIVCRVTYGETSFLFGGDAEREEEEDLVKSGARLSADVLQVNHHGSNSSSCEAFLKKVRPKWAVISVDGKSDDHPSERAVQRLRKAGAAALCTDECGTICFASDGKTITVAQSRGK